MRKIIPTCDIAIGGVHCAAGVSVEVSDFEAMQRVNDRQAVYADSETSSVETASAPRLAEKAEKKSGIQPAAWPQ